jgi:hypothetical protein
LLILYCSLDIVCAIRPELQASAIATVIVLNLSLFMVVPFIADSAGAAITEPPVIAIARSRLS